MKLNRGRCGPRFFLAVRWKLLVQLLARPEWRSMPSLGEPEMRTTPARLRIPCVFPASICMRDGQAIVSRSARSDYIGNSHKSLRLSLPLRQNPQFLGRICRIPHFEEENSLPNSLRQGILVIASGTRWTDSVESDTGSEHRGISFAASPSAWTVVALRFAE